MRKPAALIALIVAAALIVAGCGSSGSGADDKDVPTPRQAQDALRGSPPPLAQLHGEASQLLPGGDAAFRRMMASLRGHPVVVNVWAAWCGPCRGEFPVLQRAAVRYGKNVGFIGIDIQDSRSKAQGWLRDRYVAYPSLFDPKGSLGRSVGVTVGVPTTILFDRNGRAVFPHQGPYTTDASLERDLQRYAGAQPSS